jgi:hypothetical protein
MPLLHAVCLATGCRPFELCYDLSSLPCPAAACISVSREANSLPTHHIAAARWFVAGGRSNYRDVTETLGVRPHLIHFLSAPWS